MISSRLCLQRGLVGEEVDFPLPNPPPPGKGTFDLTYSGVQGNS